LTCANADGVPIVAKSTLSGDVPSGHDAGNLHRFIDAKPGRSTMVLFDGGFGLLLFGLWLFCIIDVITVDESRVRYLPKLVWLLIVLLIPDVGSIVWLVVGHTWDSQVNRAPRGAARAFPEYDRPGRQEATNPEDDEAFLRQLRARADAQRQQAERERKAREAREQSGQ
jgi:hypothetical protein